MLYWGEGTKSRNHVQLSNSDPPLVLFFLNFLRGYFSIPSGRIRLQCNLHADDDDQVREIENYWIATLGLTRESLTKSIVNSVSRASLHKRRSTLPYGTCRLTVHSTAIVQHLYGAIQEYAGFDRPAWVD